MKHFLKIIVFVFLSVCITANQSCKKKILLPTLTTLNVSGITQVSAQSGGNISNDGGAQITSRGICWSVTQNPTISSNKTNDGTGAGTFTSNMTGLTANTKYYVRAYAVNSEGISYGNEVNFTSSPIVLATLTTTTVTSIKTTTAVSGGNITDDGGAEITSRGVCWTTKANPVITDAKTSDGSGKGNFTSNLTGLQPGITYHIRAYAINSAGTAYGNDLTFTTPADYATIITLPAAAVSTTTATSGGNITSDGGATVTARGICWSTSATPFVSDSHTSDGTGSGSFISNLTGLNPDTKYYIRAYATNSVGTAYGNVVSFTTQSSKTVTDIEGNTYHFMSVGGQIWMTENLRVSKYRNGDPIPTGLNNSSWNNTNAGAYAIYNNDNSNNDKYGKLYNWYAVTDSRHICPTGWHEPSNAEWATLETFLASSGYGFGGGGNDIAKSMAAKAGWTESSLEGSVGNNQPTNNASGFTALPGGFRHYNGSYDYVDYYGFWWTISDSGPGSPDASSRYLQNISTTLEQVPYNKHKGLSVRCVKDQ